MSADIENANRLHHEGLITGAMIAQDCGAVLVAQRIRAYSGSRGTTYYGGLITAAEITEECGATRVAKQIRDRARQHVPIRAPRA
jgi:hypothetical protein